MPALSACLNEYETNASIEILYVHNLSAKKPGQRTLANRRATLGAWGCIQLTPVHTFGERNVLRKTRIRVHQGVNNLVPAFDNSFRHRITYVFRFIPFFVVFITFPSFWALGLCLPLLYQHTRQYVGSCNHTDTSHHYVTLTYNTDTVPLPCFVPPLWLWPRPSRAVRSPPRGVATVRLVPRLAGDLPWSRGRT